MKKYLLLATALSCALSPLKGENPSCANLPPPPALEEEKKELSTGKKAFYWILGTLLTLGVGVAASSADKGESAS